MPPYVWPQLGHRSARVLEHGFGPKVIGTDWWARSLTEAGMNQRVELFDHASGPRLTRTDLFRLGARAAQADAEEDDVLSFAWHVLAWGTGSGQRGNRQRIASFADPADRERNVALLRQSLTCAADGDPRSAYSTLIRPGKAAIPYLGPAFFTKVLYFASEGASGTRCLILDARVARSLHNAGWATLPHRRKNFTANWHTDTYVAYCELMQRWAEEASSELGVEVSPDEIELALFASPGS